MARIQAEMVGRALGRLHPQVTVEYRWIESEGDQVKDRPLADSGGKGLFTAALERAMLAGEADLAVHSLKDLPAQDPPGLTVAAVPRRADVRDCLISRSDAATLADLPEGAVVGTSSPRRAAQVLRVRPDVQVDLIRGNVDTRLRKVLEPEGGPGQPPRYDATLLAAAGLGRMELHAHAQRTLPTDLMLPAACQGALGIQCRADDHVTLTRCLPLNDPITATAVHAERRVVVALGADCHSPIAVLCEPVEEVGGSSGGGYRLRVRVLSMDGRTCLEVDETVPSKELRRLVKQTVEDLIARGARELLAQSSRLAAQPRRGAAEELGDLAV